MRKEKVLNLFLLVVIVVLVSVGVVSAATTISTDIITGGQVGIGTTSPAGKLSISNIGSDTTPLIIRTNGSVGNYTPTNSGIFVRDAAGAEIFRIFGSDPDDNSYNSASLFIGFEAGKNHPTDNTSAGYYNTGIGYKALHSNTEGSSKSAIGTFALESYTTGEHNTAVGHFPLDNNVTGDRNTAIGSYGLFYNQSATSSVSVGYDAGAGLDSYHNQGGTYIGYQSGVSAGSNSDYNTFLGYQSGYSVTTGAYNIAIGQNIDVPSATGNQQLNIGNILYGTGIYNGGSVSSVPVTAGKVGIGTTTPYSKFHVTAGASATTTVNFGEVGVASSKACFNTKNVAGADISFFFAGTSMIVESSLCR